MRFLFTANVALNQRYGRPSLIHKNPSKSPGRVHHLQPRLVHLLHGHSVQSDVGRADGQNM